MQKTSLLIQKALLILGVIACFYFTACKKETLPPPDADGNIWLRDITSLSLIKQTLRGNWKIHCLYGGFTGRQKTNLNSSYFRSLPNDSMYIIFEGNTYSATRPNFIRKQTEFGYTAWVLDFEFNNAWQLRDELVIESMKNDTLILVHNNPDPLGYSMTKTP